MSSRIATVLDLLLSVSLLSCICERLLLTDLSSSRCARPLGMWLLLEALLLLTLRLLSYSAPHQSHGLALVRLPIGTISRIVTIGGVLPFYFLWTLVGAAWLKEGIKDENCLEDQVELAYIVAWNVVFFMWACLYLVQILYQRAFNSPSGWLMFPGSYRFAGHTGRYRQLNRSLREPLLLRSGLSAPQIQALPVGGEGLCSICIDMVEGGGRVLPCGHAFHRECIEPWLAGRATCPNCKRSLIGL